MICGNRLSVALILGCSLPVSTLGQNADRAGWQDHRIRQGDGKGGWVSRPAWRQVLKHPDANFTMPFGLVQIMNLTVSMSCAQTGKG